MHHWFDVQTVHCGRFRSFTWEVDSGRRTVRSVCCAAGASGRRSAGRWAAAAACPSSRRPQRLGAAGARRPRTPQDRTGEAAVRPRLAARSPRPPARTLQDPDPDLAAPSAPEAGEPRHRNPRLDTDSAVRTLHVSSSLITICNEKHGI